MADVRTTLAVRGLVGDQVRVIGALDETARAARDTDTRGFVVAVRGADAVDVEVEGADGRKRTIPRVKPVIGGYPLTPRRYATDGALEYVGDVVQVWRTPDGTATCHALDGELDDGSRDANFWGRVVRAYTRHRDTDADTNTVWLDVAELKTGQIIPARATEATQGVKEGDRVLIARDDGGPVRERRFSFGAPQYYAVARRRPADDYNAAFPRPPAATSLYTEPTVGFDKPRANSEAIIRLFAFRLARPRRVDRDTVPPVIWGAARTASTVRIGTSQIADAGRDIDMRLQVWTRARRDIVEVSSGGRVSSAGDPTDTTPSEVISRSRSRDWVNPYNGRRFDFDVRAARSVSVFYVDVTRPEVEGSTRYSILLERGNPYGDPNWRTTQ